MMSKLWLFYIILALGFTFQFSYAQHHSGEQAPPISFGSGEVTVTTTLFPADFTPQKYSDVNLKIRFFDVKSNVNIEHVSYRVQIFYGDQRVANQMFFDKDGELVVKIQPKPNCIQEELWKCTKYYGDVDPIVPGAISSTPSSIPVISGPVFVNSGEYTVKTEIIGAKNPKTQTGQDIFFETIVIIPNEQQFQITSAGTEYTMFVKNFQGPLNQLQFDDSSKSITFEMPFNWERVVSVKNYFEIPKNFLPFENVNSFYGKANGVLVSPKSIYYDKYSDKSNNILHFMIDNDELKQIKSSDSKLRVVITPESQSSIKSQELLFDNGIKAIASYDSRYSNTNDLLFSIVFFDSKGNLSKDIRYGYGLKTPSGKEIVNTGGNMQLMGIALPNGIDTQVLSTSMPGKYSMQIVLLGTGQNTFDRPLFQNFDFELTSEVSNNMATEYKIPTWIKSNAGWWADGKIDDNSFVQGIQFLIKEKIMNIPDTQSVGTASNEIPSWIKNNAKWWADGKIDDNSFVQGIQFLVKAGIITP